MKRLLLCALALGFGAAGCSKSSASSSVSAGSASAAPAAPSKPGEPRKVSIEAGSKGFVPDTIEGKPGEKLELVFTRTVDGDCMSQVKFEGQKPIELPKDQAVVVPITVPTTGRMQFACAMDMNTGVIVPRS
jgi:plastocyanin domain-containing protein